jgi:hypothetical protein
MAEAPSPGCEVQPESPPVALIRAEDEKAALAHQLKSARQGAWIEMKDPREIPGGHSRKLADDADNQPLPSGDPEPCLHEAGCGGQAVVDGPEQPEEVHHVSEGTGVRLRPEVSILMSHGLFLVSQESGAKRRSPLTCNFPI